MVVVTYIEVVLRARTLCIIKLTLVDLGLQVSIQSPCIILIWRSEDAANVSVGVTLTERGSIPVAIS